MSKLLDKILKNSTTKLTSVLSESVMFKDKDIIPIDVPLLNIAFSGDLDGGLASGLTLLAGPSKSFKSLMSLIMVRAYMNKYPDAVCILYDSEGGMTPQYLSEMGVDTARVVHVPIEHLEMLKFDTVKQLSELSRGDHVIMVIDSIGNTASQKELVDALDEKSVAEMQRAKSIKGLFRMITPSLVIKDIPCICICHTYATMEMFSKQIISGGCLIEDTKLIMGDGSTEVIQKIQVGDQVMTLEGPKSVTHIWNPETLENGTPECYEIEFDDGHVVTCSDKHPFLTPDGWVCVEDLTGDEDMVSVDTQVRRIKRIQKVGTRPVYDISVADVHHYVLENGVVTHNTGLMYSANQAFIIGKSQEKDGTELAGWNFTLNVEKSRWVKEKSKLPLQVLYDSGIQKYSGILDLALESGHVIKPKNGWYALVDMETGVISEKNFRIKDTNSEDFLGKVVAQESFKKFIRERYRIGSMTGKESVEVPEEDLED